MGTNRIPARSAALAVAVLGLAGCGVGSVAPIVPEGEAQFDPALLGTWVDEDGTERAVITADGADGYAILYTDDGGESGPFLGRLGDLGAHRVLDVWPDPTGIRGNDAFRDLMLPLHTALFIDSLGDRVGFRMLTPDSLSDYLEREPGAVAHVRLDDILVLTAPTAELRRFLAEFAGRPGTLGSPAVWVRGGEGDAP